MPEHLDHFMMSQSPTAERPLLGLTVLVVEDSRFASESMRLLCLRSGARIRRADSLKSARRHLAGYRPAVVIVDLGLPDGSGADLIRELAQASARVGVILGMSGDDNGQKLATDAGADGYLPKPIDRLSRFQQAVLAHLPASQHPRGPQLVEDEPIIPDPMALRDDLAHISDVLTTSQNDDRAIAYVAQFLSGLARLADDTSLAAAANELDEHHRTGKPTGTDVARIAGMVQERLQNRSII